MPSDKWAYTCHKCNSTIINQSPKNGPLPSQKVECFLWLVAKSRYHTEICVPRNATVHSNYFSNFSLKTSTQSLDPLYDLVLDQWSIVKLEWREHLTNFKCRACHCCIITWSRKDPPPALAAILNTLNLASSLQSGFILSTAWQIACLQCASILHMLV